MIRRKQRRSARIGIFGVGHATYWNQFPGLLENLMGYHQRLKELIPDQEIQLADYGMVDNCETAYHVLDRMKGDRLDLVFCNMLTYATSSVFAPIVRDLGLPIVLVALQPRLAMDYSQANTFMQLENDNICSVPEFTGVAIRLGKPVEDVIIGTLEDPQAKKELASWW